MGNSINQKNMFQKKHGIVYHSGRYKKISIEECNGFNDLFNFIYDEGNITNPITNLMNNTPLLTQRGERHCDNSNNSSENSSENSENGGENNENSSEKDFMRQWNTEYLHIARYIDCLFKKDIQLFKWRIPIINAFVLAEIEQKYINGNNITQLMIDLMKMPYRERSAVNMLHIAYLSKWLNSSFNLKLPKELRELYKRWYSNRHNLHDYAFVVDFPINFIGFNKRKIYFDEETEEVLFI